MANTFHIPDLSKFSISDLDRYRQQIHEQYMNPVAQQLNQNDEPSPFSPPLRVPNAEVPISDISIGLSLMPQGNHNYYIPNSLGKRPPPVDLLNNPLLNHVHKFEGNHDISHTLTFQAVPMDLPNNPFSSQVNQVAGAHLLPVPPLPTIANGLPPIIVNSSKPEAIDKCIQQLYDRQNRPLGFMTFDEIMNRETVGNLLTPEARFMDSLGIARRERLLVPSLLTVNPTDNLSVLTHKVNCIIQRVEQNKAFWKQSFSDFFSDPSFLHSNQKVTLLDVGPKLGYESLYKPEYQQKYEVLSNFDGISPVPFTDELENNVSNFNRGAQDDAHIAYFLKNQATYPKGSKERLTKDYLEKNLKGPAPGAAANFAYFTGALKNRIHNFFKAVKSEMQKGPMPLFVSIPCTNISLIANSDIAKGLAVVTNNTPFLKSLGVSEKFQSAIEILKIADEKSMAMQLAIQNGENPDEVLQDTFSAVYTAGLSGCITNSMRTSDKKLMSKTKGAIHGALDFIHQHWEDLERFSYYVGAEQFADFLAPDERVQLQKKLNQKVDRHTANFNHFVQRAFNINPLDAAYLSARKFTHIGLNVATMATAAYGIFRGAYLARQAAKLPAHFKTFASQRPGPIQNLFSKTLFNSEGKLKQFKFMPRTSRHLSRRVLKVIAHENNQLTNLVNSYVNSTFQESIQLHRTAKAFLKPYIKTFMPEEQARALIHKTKIPTFPRPEGIPENYIVKISNNGAGMIYRHPTNTGTYVRVMPGKPHSPFFYQRKPYVVQKINGTCLDKFGNFVTREAPEAHIPVQEFNYLNK